MNRTHQPKSWLDECRQTQTNPDPRVLPPTTHPLLTTQLNASHWLELMHQLPALAKQHIVTLNETHVPSLVRVLMAVCLLTAKARLIHKQ